MYDCGEFECISPGPKIKKKGVAKVAPPKFGGRALGKVGTTVRLRLSAILCKAGVPT